VAAVLRPGVNIKRSPCVGAEWGFDGVVVPDWGAVHDRVAAVRAGASSRDLPLEEFVRMVGNMPLSHLAFFAGITVDADAANELLAAVPAA
jgi:hypothetical protein